MDNPAQNALPSCSKAIKTITVVHHKRVTPAYGLPITPQGEKLQPGGQRKVISLLVSPVESGSKSVESKNSSESANSVPDPVKISDVTAPRPVNLVRRIANNQTVSSALSEALPFIPSATRAAKSPPGTSSTTTNPEVKRSDGAQAPSLLPGQSHTPGQKSVRVVTINPTNSPVGRPAGNSEETLRNARNPDYNLTLLDYLNKTLSKSGRVKMIKDGNQLREEIRNAGDRLVVLDFFSMGSPACQRTAPQVQHLSLEYKDVIFLKVDVEHTQDATLMFKVQTTPTFVLLQHGVRVCQLETPDVIELEERIKAFRFQVPPKSRLVMALQKKPKDVSGNSLEKTGHLTKENWELDQVTGQMKKKSSIAKESNPSSSTDFVRHVLKDWLVTKASDEGTERRADIKPHKVTLPFLSEEEVQIILPPEKDDKEENDDVDVENVDENSDLKSSMVFDSVKVSDSWSMKQYVSSKEKQNSSLPKKKNSQQSRSKSPSVAITATQAPVVVSPYPAMPFVSQEEPRDIEIAVPLTTVTPTSSPFKGKMVPSIQKLFDSPESFWQSISKDVIEDSDEDINMTDDHVELDDDNGGGDDGHDDPDKGGGGRFRGKSEGTGTVARSRSVPRDFAERTSDSLPDGESVKSMSWLSRPNSTTPLTLARPKSSNIIVTEKVFVSGEDTFLKERPGDSSQCAYFSISSRPRQSSRSTELNSANESGVVSPSSSKRPGSSNALFVQVPPLENSKKKSNKRQISSLKYKGNHGVPEKRTKTEERKPEKKFTLSMSQPDDNSDDCYVILSRDPKIEQLLIAKKSVPLKKKHTSSGPANAVFKKQRTLGNQETDDSTEDSDLDLKKDIGESGMNATSDRTHVAQMLMEPGAKCCPVCGLTMHDRSTLLRHMRMRHDLDPDAPDLMKSPLPTEPITHSMPGTKNASVFFCQKCDRDFKTASGLTSHTMHIHGNVTKNDKSQSYTNDGSQSCTNSGTGSGSEIWTCVLCDKDFNSSMGLLRHNSLLHKNTKEGTMFAQSLRVTYCWKCQKNYSNTDSLRRHVKIFHRVKSGILPPKPTTSIESSRTVPRPQQKTGGSKPAEGDVKVTLVKDVYQCPACQVIYSDKNSCRKHISRVHRRKLGVLVIRMNVDKQDTPQGGRGLKCRRCQEIFSNMSNLLLHIREKHKPVGWSGVEEGDLTKGSTEKTPNRDTSKESRHQTPQSDGPYTPPSRMMCKCRQCGQRYANPANLKRHQLKHHGKVMTPLHDQARSEEEVKGTSEKVKVTQLKPKVTPATSKVKENVKPKVTPKPEEPCYTCKCGERFTNFANLMKHIAVDHQQKTAKKLVDIVSEVSIEGEEEETEESPEDNPEDQEEEERRGGKEEDKTFTCERCGRQYANHSNLERHKKVVHKMKSVMEKLGIFGTKCKVCQKEFATEMSMKKHYIVAHRRKVKVQSVKKSASSQAVRKKEPKLPNAHTCPRCGKWFTGPSSLCRHLAATHKITDSYLQKQAGKFDASETEDASLDTSSFRCPMCGRKNSSLGNLTRHMRNIHQISNIQGSNKLGLMKTLKTSPKGSAAPDTQDCDMCVKFIMRIRDLRQHLHVSHHMRLSAWDSQGLKAQISLLRMYMCKQLRSTFGPNSCITCIRSRLLLRAISRHCSVPHSKKFRIPTARYVRNTGMSPRIAHLPKVARSAESVKTLNSIQSPHFSKTPSSLKNPTSSKTPIPMKSPSSSMSVGSLPLLKESKLLVKITPVDSVLMASKSFATTTTPTSTTTTTTTALSSMGLLDSNTDEKFDYVCQICNCGFWLANSLLRHQNTLLPEKTRICKKCGSGFRSCQALSVHYAEGCESMPQEEEEGESERYKCEVCKESFAQLDSLVRHHKQQHRKAVHSCKFCPAMFRTLSYLRYHIKRKHVNKGSDEDRGRASEPIVHPIGEAVANQAIRIKTEPQDDPSCAPESKVAVVMCEGETDPVTVVKTEPQNYYPGESTPMSAGEEAIGASVSGDSVASSQGEQSKPYIQMNDGRYQCKNCGALFQTLKPLVEHQKVQHSNIRHKCPKCPAGFKTRIYLNYHCKQQHGITDPETERPVAAAGRTSTPTSDKMNENPDLDYQTSLSLEEPEHRFTCPFCMVGFRTMFYLRYHLNALHGIDDLDDEEYEGVSHKSQQTKGGSHTSHLSTKDGQRKKGIPLKSFQNFKLTKNSRKGPGSYRCQICGSKFQLKKSLGRHFREQHKETTCRCHVCDAEFTTHSYLLYHLNSQHGLEEGEIIAKKTRVSKPEEKSPTECDICGAKFSYHKSLRPHKLSQHKVINHHCMKCPAGFTTAQYLGQHLRCQHGVVGQTPAPAPLEQKYEIPVERKHVCSVCKASFLNLSTIRHHVREQHGHTSSLFTCSHCSAGFMSHSYYRHHLKVQHGVTIDVEKPKTDAPKPGPDGRFECPVCSASFSHHKSVVQHSNLQHKNIRYRCKICKAGFRKRCFLDYHLKKRHGVEEGSDKEHSVNLVTAKKSVSDDLSDQEETSDCAPNVSEMSDQIVKEGVTKVSDKGSDVDMVDGDVASRCEPEGFGQIGPEKETSEHVSEGQNCPDVPVESGLTEEGDADLVSSEGDKEKVPDIKEIADNGPSAEECQANGERRESRCDNVDCSVQNQVNFSESDEYQENPEVSEGGEVIKVKPEELVSVETPEGQ